MNLLNGYLAPVGVIVDLLSDKRFSYPNNIRIRADTATNEYQRIWDEHKPGDFAFFASLPTVSYYRYSSDLAPNFVNAGLFGGTIGVDYNHSTRHYYRATVGTLISFTTWQQNWLSDGVFSSHLLLSRHTRRDRLTLGYGPALVSNRYTDEFLEDQRFQQTITSLGANFSTYVKLSQQTNLGLLYRPTFFNFNGNQRFDYQYALTLDLQWKFLYR